MNSRELNINDKWLFIFVYPVLGISIVHIGNDNTLKELLLIPSYYTDIILALTVIYIVGFYIRYILLKLEKNFDWETQQQPRIKYHFFWGLLIPALFAVSLELVYLTLINIPIKSSSVFYLELPLIIVYLILINLTYYILYFRLHTSGLKSALIEQTTNNDLTHEKFLLAKKGNQFIQITYSSIAYFILKDKLTFLVTKDNRQYFFDKSIKEVMDVLPKNQFYRINRQLISSRSSIVKCIPTKTRRLKIELNPPSEEDIFLPKAKASLFMSWLNQG